MTRSVSLIQALATTALLAGALPALAQDEGGNAPPSKDAPFKERENVRAKAREAAKAKAAAAAAARGEAPADAPAAPEPKVAQATPPAEKAAEKPADKPTDKPADKKGDGDDKKGAAVDLTTCKPMSGKLNFNFEKATINEVLDQISRIKCMNFILSDAVKGKTDISIVSRSPVTVAQAYAAFLSALEANGMALVPAGTFWKVVERKDAAKTTVPMYEIKDGVLMRVTPDEKREGDMPNSDAQVTLLYEVRYANKDQVEGLIKNLMSKNADLQKPAGNLLILTDSGNNILRILEVLDKVDVEGTSNKLNVVTLQYADVSSVAQKLNEIFAPSGSGKKGETTRAPRATSKVEGKGDEAKDVKDAKDAGGDEGDIGDVTIEKIIAEDRTNQLIVISSARAFERVLEVLRILDVPTQGGSELKMWVVPLANTDAQKAAGTLSSLASGAAAKKPSTDKGGAKAKEAEQAAALFEGEVKVTADETTNSLVVVASYRDFRALQRVIEQLDVRRPQVFVEAAIMEVALTQDRRVGLNAYVAAPVPIPGSDTPGIAIAANEGGKQIFQSSAKVATGLQLLQQLADDNRLDAAAAAQGLELVNDLSSLIGVAGFIGPSVPILTDETGKALVSLPSVSTVLNLLQTNANVDILSTPHLITTDNEKAELSVGQRVPVVRGYTPTGGAGALGFGGMQQVAYEDVKLKFTLTPHVNSEDEIRIELEQEVSDLGGQVSVGNGLTQPIITNRTVKNTLVAKDQQTIVVAGLIQDRKSDTESKVPFFGDIPIIGWLFKTWNDSKQKTNLLIMLTPYVVRDEEDFRKIYDRKMNERKQFVDAYFSDARVYNPYVDYDKKNGPLGALLRQVEWENDKIENGGPGHGEEVIGPDLGIKPRKIGGDDGGHGGPPPEGGAAPLPDGSADAPDAPPPPTETPPPPPAG
ncbi:MAG: type II secretion system secretin GspD [Deltaproteobacteria bacterium]|nr:type II secretion system secretin GspD [Deltaproteobacteria bacterium]